METIILSAFVLLNLLGFAFMLFDKYRAKTNGWRIPEKRLFFIAFLGGAIGIFIGMRMVRHKTKHSTFVYGIPFFILFNLVALYALLFQISV